MSEKHSVDVQQIEVEVLEVFRSSLSQQNVALPVAAMTALVHRIRVSLCLLQSFCPSNLTIDLS